VIKVIRGNPTPEELAAAVTVVRARATAAAGVPESARQGGTRAPGTRGAWADPARVARTRLPAPGPRAWGRTFWPI
jgi:hypothetical protein